MAAPTQGGIGAYHWMVKEALKVVGVDNDMGLTFATVVHSSQVLMILLTGVIALILWYQASRRKEKLGAEVGPWSESSSL